MSTFIFNEFLGEMLEEAATLNSWRLGIRITISYAINPKLVQERESKEIPPMQKRHHTTKK